MAFYSLSDIQSWERFYRGNFINSLSGFKSASLIATVNKAGNSNLGIFSNIVHIGADPALIGFVNRPKEAARHTLRDIVRNRQEKRTGATYAQQYRSNRTVYHQSYSGEPY